MLEARHPPGRRVDGRASPRRRVCEERNRPEGTCSGSLPAAQQLREDSVVVADDHRLPDPDRRCAQVSRRSEHRRRDLVRIVLVRPELHDRLPLRDDHLGRRFGQLERLRLAELSARGDRLLRLDAPCLQELGGPPAGRSAVAVVVPVDLLCHFHLLFGSFDS